MAWLFFVMHNSDLMPFTQHSPDDEIQDCTHNSWALQCTILQFNFVWLIQVEGKQRESPFWWCNITFCLNPLTGLCETINESVLFSGGSVLVKVSVMKLLFFILTLLEPPSPFQINIQKPLIKNPPPHPPLEQDKQIWGCVCSLLAHPILYFNDFTSTSEEKKCKMARCSRMWHKKMKTRHSCGWVRRELVAEGGEGRGVCVGGWTVSHSCG